MKSTPITIYSGVALIDEEYIDIEASGTPLDLSAYDLQMQILDADNNYAVLHTPTITKGATVGRIWPEFTAAQSTDLLNKNTIWVLLLRPTSGGDARLIGHGRVDVNRGAIWQ